jgi:membrane protein required for colicin V production
MNGADIAILAVLALSVVIGVIRGLVVEVMSLLSWVAAVVAAMYFGPMVGEWFAGSVTLPSARVALGYSIVFVVALLAGGIVMFLLRKIVKGTGLSGTDRMLGLVFGMARGLVIVVALVLLGGLTPFPRDTWWQESRALPAFEEMAGHASAYLPEALRRHIDYTGAPAAPPAPAPAQPEAEPQKDA